MNAQIKKHLPPLLSGILLALSFPAVSLYFLAWIALVPLLVFAARHTPRECGASFFFAGWVFHSIALHWLMTNVMWGGGFAFIGYQLLCMALAFFWGLLGYVWRSAHAHSPGLLSALTFAALWTLLEAAHAHLFTGFGWSALAYSQGPDLAILQWAALGGTPLVGFLIALVNALLALAYAERRWRILRAGAAVLILGIAHLAGAMLLGTSEQTPAPFRVGLVQTNYAQEMKWDREYTYEMIDRAAAKSYALGRYADLDLLVWPEATVMTDFANPRAADRLRALAQDVDAALFTGAVRHENGLSFNSSVLVSPDGAIAGHYDKIHLAPFGEYAPLSEWLPFLREVVPGEMAAGAEPRIFTVAGRQLGPLICFEVLFAAMAEDLRAAGADVLLVVTNLGWFGASSALPQELEMARLRAIETRLPLVHCANTGITGVFDAWGRFEVVNGYVSDDGRFIPRAGAPLPPMATRLQRVADIFEVPPAAERPWPAGTVLIPWTLWLSGALLPLLAVLLGRRRAVKLQAQ